MGDHESAAQPPDPLVGGVVAERYRIHRLLGEGGMGAVYEAADEQSGAIVALKIVHASMARGDILARFAREAKLAMSLRHPHVVSVLAVGEDVSRGLPYMVMPLLRGEDLADCLDRARPLDPTVAARIALQACEGIGAAHAAGIVHRDIKPSNLYLEEGPGDEVVVRVVDFGIGKEILPGSDASQAGGGLTRTGTALGTPLYMSPEQARSGKHVDTRSDIYAMGVVLYEMLVGAAPYGHLESVSEILVAILTVTPAPVSERAPWVPDALAAAVTSALERDRERRPPSILAFADLLRPFAGGTNRITRAMLRPMSGERVAELSSSSEGHARTISIDELRTSEPADPLVGRVLGGKYPVIRRVGLGGMGAVYEVRCPDGRSAAAKVISSDALGRGDETVRRFLREASAATSIRSPHVVETIELGTDAQLGAPFILMELLVGLDLAAALRDRSPLEPSGAAHVFLQAARGLAAAHRQGVVHRDIKPANLFLHGPDDGPITVKVCDFGIAKRSDEAGADSSTQDLTRTGGMLGSPAYMSPEQARSAKRVDHRSDLWSLSVSMYEALAGQRLWEPTSFGEILVAILTAPIPPLTGVAPWVPAGLAAVVHRGLERDVAARWQSADDLIAALEPFCAGEHVLQRDVRRAQAAGAMGAGRRAATAGTAHPPEAGTEATAVLGSAPRAAPPSRKGAKIAAAAGIAMVMAAAATLTRARWTTSPAAAPDETTTSAELPRSASIEVVPAGATVRVDGNPAAPVNGRLELRGQPGDSFEVTLEHEGASQSFTVMVRRDGTAAPARLEATGKPAVTPVATVTASASVAPPARAVVRPGPTTPTPPATTRPIQPPPPAGAKALGPRENW